MIQKNKLTHGSNLLWEGSRMMLPEHRERLLQHRRELQMKRKPELDEHQWEKIQRIISKSLHQKIEITLILYGEVFDRRITGYVVRADTSKGRLLIQTEDYDEWIKTNQIIAAEEQSEDYL